MSGDASLAKLLRDHGDQWEIEKVQRGTEWIAVDRDTSGDYIRIIAAHDLHQLRYRINEAELDQPDEREPATGP